MLNLIFGNKGCGKTSLCYDIIAQKIKNKEQVFFIVPEQQAVKAERSIALRFGNESNLYVEVINFKRLCNRVFRECGGIAKGHADKAAKLLCLSKALNECADLLHIYKGCTSEVGFIKKLLGVIDMFESCCVTPSFLAKLSQKLCDDPSCSGLCNKLFDLSLIFGSYTQQLEENFGWNCDLLGALTQTLQSNDFFKDKCVIIDSFFGFTQAETDIIKRIVSTAKDVYITFCWDGKSKSELYLRCRRSFEQLKRICDSENVKYSTTFLSKNLRHQSGSGLFMLESEFTVERLAQAGKSDCKDDIKIISCDDTYKECSCAANLISKLVSDGAQFRDICVCVPDTERYEGIIDTVFEKHDIPFYMSQKEKLTEKPVISLLFGAFDIYLSSFARLHILRFIKSGLCGLGFKEANLLDRYIRTWNLSGKRFTNQLFEASPSGYCETMTSEDKEQLDIINTSHQKLLLLLDPFCTALKQGKTVLHYSTAVYEFLCRIHEINANDQSFECQNSAFYQMIYNALDTICTVYKNEKISVTSFYKIFEMCISCYDFGAIPSSLDEIEIAPVSLVRCDNVKHVIIMGANDGVLPASAGTQEIFAETEKQLLEDNNVFLSPKSTEQIYDGLFLCMCACLSAKQSAFVLYANNDFSGEQLNPSVFVFMLKNIFPQNKVQKYPFENPLDNICNPNTAFEEMFTYQSPALRMSLEKYFKNHAVFSKDLTKLNSDYLCPDKLSEKVTQSLYKDKMTSSVTRLESFNLCPFSYFSRYTLGLKPEPKAQLGPIEIGNISHRVMEIFCKKLAEKKACGGVVYTKEETEKIIKEILSDYLDLFLHSKQRASSRFMFLYGRISATIISLAKSIAAEMAQSLFSACDFELSINNDGALKPARLSVVKDGKSIAALEIIGQIDRVDIYKADGKTFIRIADYKTGTKKFEKDKIAYGINLQMLLYLYSVIAGGKERYGKDIVPCAVLYIPCVLPDEKVFLGQDTKNNEHTFTAKGIVVDDMHIVRAMERDVGGLYIPVTLKKDGGFSASSSVASIGEMKQLLNTACKAASTLAKEIMSGDIRVSPYKCKDLNSCTFCDYKSFCDYDRELCSPRYELEKKCELSQGGDAVK